jgi:rhomboid-like protein
MIINQNLDGLNDILIRSNSSQLAEYVTLNLTPMVGASGAISGLMVAFAILFPNTEFLLYFAIPVKAKYLVAAYFVFDVYMAIQNEAGDTTAHLAHIGGAIVGAIIVLIWRKKDRTNFW